MTQSKISFNARLSNFRHHFEKMGVEGFIIENPVDIAYFTGLSLSRGRLLIGPQKALLFVDGRYSESAKTHSPIPVKPLENQALIDALKDQQEVKQWGFDTGLSVAMALKLQELFGKIPLKGVDQPTDCVRLIKDERELELIEKSAELLWRGFLYLRGRLREGVQEKELAREFEFYVKTEGAEALSFTPIVAFGDHSALPHHRSGSRTLKRGDLVLLDLGVVLEGYASDMTRVIFFGDVAERLQEIYKCVRRAHQAALDLCAPGALISSLDLAARKEMGDDEKYFVHSLGHGIGLEVHEAPRISKERDKETLKEGMVITIEPGLYLPGLGGVRYEDMVVITKSGYRNLFKQTDP